MLSLDFPKGGDGTHTRRALAATASSRPPYGVGLGSYAFVLCARTIGLAGPCWGNELLSASERGFSSHSTAMAKPWQLWERVQGTRVASLNAPEYFSDQPVRDLETSPADHVSPDWPSGEVGVKTVRRVACCESGFL